VVDAFAVRTTAGGLVADPVQRAAVEDALRAAVPRHRPAPSQG